MPKDTITTTSGFPKWTAPTTPQHEADVKAKKTPAQKAAATRARNKRAAAKEAAATPEPTVPVVEFVPAVSEGVVAANEPAGQDPADPAKNVDGITDPGTTLGTKSPNPDGIKKPGSTLDS